MIPGVHLFLSSEDPRGCDALKATAPPLFAAAHMPCGRPAAPVTSGPAGLRVGDGDDEQAAGARGEQRHDQLLRARERRPLDAERGDEVADGDGAREDDVAETIHELPALPGVRADERAGAVGARDHGDEGLPDASAAGDDGEHDDREARGDEGGGHDADEQELEDERDRDDVRQEPDDVVRERQESERSVGLAQSDLLGSLITGL
jgi:hypothetical protein